eukprot:scaffold45777_cov31-Tisochrysis_lutea.AAC.4
MSRRWAFSYKTMAACGSLCTAWIWARLERAESHSGAASRTAVKIERASTNRPTRCQKVGSDRIAHRWKSDEKTNPA